MKRKICLIRRYLLAALALTVAMAGCSAPQKPENPVSSSSVQAEASSSSAQDAVMEPIDLGDGLVLDTVFAAAGAFPEDGSDTPVDNMLCAAFTNNAEATLQYAKVAVALNGADYSFEITTIPPGKSVYAFDMAMQQTPESIGSISAAAEYLVFFPEEPTVDAQRLQIAIGDGSITVKNISKENIDKDIFVYYKRVVDETYLGGITYRVRVGTLAAGEEKTGFSSHAGSDAELMFVTYGS